MEQVVRGLRARGHHVDVVTSVPHYDGFRVAKAYRRKPFEREPQRGGEVVRLPAIATGNKSSMADRLLSYGAWGVLSALGGAARRGDYDVILAPNGGFFTGVSGRFVSRLKGAPLVFNVQDLYPDVPLESGQLRAGGAVAALEAIARSMYRGADHIVAITEGMKQRLVAKGVPEAKVDVIPNFVDVDFITPLPKDNAWSRREGLHDKFVVAHAGNVGFVYDLDAMLDAAKMMEDDPRVVFLIVGEGAAKAGLQARAKELSLGNVRFLPYQPRDELPLMRAACDVQVALYKRNSARNSMPSKVYEVMASGRPLLASAEPESDLGQLVARAGCGLCVHPEDPKALVDALRRLKGEPALSAAMGKDGRAAAERDHSVAAVVQRYEAVLAKAARR